MGLGWDELGDLNLYNGKKQIKERLQKLENTESSKKIDTAANFEFVNEIKAQRYCNRKKR